MKSSTTCRPRCVLAPAFASAVFGTCIFVSWTLADVSIIKDVGYLEPGRTETLDLYLPERTLLDPPAPAVLWIHGGGWMVGTKGETRAQKVCGTLAAAGYVCASVDYRLGEGSWPGNLYDCKNAIRFLRVHAADYHIDPKRLAVLGGSAGGHLALMVGFTTGEPGFEPSAPSPYPGVSSAVSAVVDFYGITDLMTWQQPSSTGQVTGVPPKDISISATVFRATREAYPELWRAASPVNHVTAATPPVLIVHGLVDPVIGYEQAQELDRILTAKGVPHELILLEGVGHTFDLTTWNEKPLPYDLRPALLGFLGRYLGIPVHGIPVTSLPVSPRLH